MVTLLTLPAELRLHIYTFLPTLHPQCSTPTSLPIQRQSPIIPAICRTHPLLRHETLPLYASNNHFNASMDDGGSTALQPWLTCLGDYLNDVSSLQLQQHWKLQAPLRWQGHIGFYVRLEKGREGWKISSGTYPFVNDVRGGESLGLLKRALGSLEVLGREDVEVLVRLMDVIARHPIPAHDAEQRGRRSSIFESMEREMVGVVGRKLECASD